MICELFDGQIEVKYESLKKYDGHYKFTPYSYRTENIKKVQLKSYIDLGSGILNCLKNIQNSEL